MVTTNKAYEGDDSPTRSFLRARETKSQEEFLRFQQEMQSRGYNLTKDYRGPGFREMSNVAGRHEVWLEGAGFNFKVGKGQDLSTALATAKEEVKTLLANPELFHPGRMGR